MNPPALPNPLYLYAFMERDDKKKRKGVTPTTPSVNEIQMLYDCFIGIIPETKIKMELKCLWEGEGAEDSQILEKYKNGGKMNNEGWEKPGV